MSLNTGINLISNKWAGVEIGAVKQISAEIMQNANTKTVDLSQVNLSAFKRPELGVDFYSPKTSIEAQRQISISNSNMQVNTPISTGFLNAQAASNLYSGQNITKAVEGKMAPAIAEGEKESTKEVFSLSRNLEVYNTSKDKKGSGSNPFFGGQTAQGNGEKQEGLNIVG